MLSALKAVGKRVEAQRVGVSHGELPVCPLEQTVVGAPRVKGSVRIRVRLGLRV